MKKQGKEDLTVLAGRNAVMEILQDTPERVEKVMLQRTEGKALSRLRQQADRVGVPVQHVPAARLNRVAPGVNHQGAVALITPLGYMDLDEMLSSIAPTLADVQARKPLVLLLDRMEDAHNLGAVLRSAVAMGVEGVIVPTRFMAPLGAVAIKTSAGTARHARIARVTNLVEVIGQLKERGYWVAGATGTGETTLWAMDWDRPIALVVGGEDKGLRPVVEKACDFQVSIPMRGPAESLNASVATGILLCEATRCRH